MPSRTDDRPQTKSRDVSPASDSRLASSPTVSPAQQTSDDHLLTEESIRAILSSHHRAGRWEAADDIQARAIFGEVTLDFTRADLPPSGVIEIEAWAIGGEILIILPDGAELELEGTPFLGSIEQHTRKKGARDRIRELISGERDEDIPGPAAPEEPPFFRIDGHAIMGTIKVMGR